MVNNLSNTTFNTAQTQISQQRPVLRYAIANPITEKQKEEAQEKKTKKLGLKIGGTVLAVGLAVLGLTKGMPKRARFKINEVVHRLEEKSLKLSNKNNKTDIEKLYYSGIKRLKSLTNLLQGACNTTPLKDTYFKNLMTDKIPFMKKMCDACDNFFEKMSVKITKKTYSKTAEKFDDIYTTMTTSAEKMDRKTKESIISRIGKLKDTTYELLSERNFSQRVTNMSNDMNNLNNEVWNELNPKKIKSFFGKKESYTTFLSEKLAAPAKIKAGNIVSTLKNSISISVVDKTATLKKLSQTLDGFVTNNSSSKELNQIRKEIAKYSKTGDTDTLNALIKKINDFSDNITDKNIQKEIKNSLNILSTTKNGQIQELMAIYKNNLSQEEYAKLEKRVNKALNSLNNATNKETNLLFDKIRDIKIGSIFTDLSSLVIPIVTAGLMLGKAEGKDEKTSVALKYGVPAIGAVSVCLLCTVNLISGLPALAIGLGSGWLMNKIGAAIDNERKKSNMKNTLKEKIQLS